MPTDIGTYYCNRSWLERESKSGDVALRPNVYFTSFVHGNAYLTNISSAIILIWQKADLIHCALRAKQSGLAEMTGAKSAAARFHCY
jgi:hypothetical protein